MSDRPWLEDGDPSLRIERTLLKRLNAQEPPSGSVDQGWSAIAAEIAAMQGISALGASSVHATHAAAHGAGGFSLGLAAKLALGVTLAGGALWGGSALLQPETTSPTPRHDVNVPAESPRDVRTPAPPVIAQEPQDTQEQASAKQPTPANPARPQSSATTLVEEGRLLAKAHELVQAGQGQQALEVLRLSQARYPRSVLYQEREVLTIEALAATGNSSAAKQRAERFLKRYPTSPHVGRLQRFVE